MLFRRFYADSAKARQLLRNAFERMEQPGYTKNEAQVQEIIRAAKDLDIAPDVVSQVYKSTVVSETPKSGDKAAGSVPQNPARQRAAAQQADLEMFGPPKNEQYSSPEFQYDDLPSLGHLHLEEHRDHRQFLRAAAYELPLLTQYRSEYRPVAHNPQANLRFKHFAFPTEENHPAASKVVMSFSPSSLVELDDAQRHKLKLLAGRRYDSSRDIVKVSSSRFPTQAQNKRYLVQLFERLAAASRENAAEFADIPLDERHTLKRLAKKGTSIYPSQHRWPDAWSRPDLAPKKADDIFALNGVKAALK